MVGSQYWIYGDAFMDNVQGNVSTIGVMIWTILCPYISQYVSQEVFLAIFGLLIVLWSAYNPNTFKVLGNGKTETIELGSILEGIYTK